MSKKFNGIKKGLTEAIEDIERGSLGTRFHRPHLRLIMLSWLAHFGDNFS
jgi:hypothetical protein